MRWWTPVSAAVAPVALIGGWTLAASRRSDFDSTRDTISALAAVDAPQRWIMTAGLTVTGVCHLLTAAGLTPAQWPGRYLLAAAGVASLGVAVFPLPSEHGSCAAHTISATSAFVALSLWPALAARASGGLDPLGRPVCYWASGVLITALGVFAVSLGQGRYVGFTERVAARSQVLWPLVVVVAVQVARRHAGKGCYQCPPSL